jgi:hypothetical protein
MKARRFLAALVVATKHLLQFGRGDQDMAGFVFLEIA